MCIFFNYHAILNALSHENALMYLLHVIIYPSSMTIFLYLSPISHLLILHLRCHSGQDEHHSPGFVAFRFGDDSRDTDGKCDRGGITGWGETNQNHAVDYMIVFRLVPMKCCKTQRGIYAQ